MNCVGVPNSTEPRNPPRFDFPRGPDVGLPWQDFIKLSRSALDEFAGLAPEDTKGGE